MGWNCIGQFSMLLPKEIPSLHHQFVCNKHHWKTERKISCLKSCLIMRFTFFLFSNTLSTQMSFVSSNGIFVNSDEISKYAMKDLDLDQGFLYKTKKNIWQIFIDRKLLQYWYKKFCKFVITSTNCWQNWTEWGMLSLAVVPLWTLHSPYKIHGLLARGFKNL